MCRTRIPDVRNYNLGQIQIIYRSHRIYNDPSLSKYGWIEAAAEADHKHKWCRAFGDGHYCFIIPFLRMFMSAGYNNNSNLIVQCRVISAAQRKRQTCKSCITKKKAIEKSTCVSIHLTPWWRRRDACHMQMKLKVRPRFVRASSSSRADAVDYFLITKAKLSITKTQLQSNNPSQGPPFNLSSSSSWFKWSKCFPIRRRDVLCAEGVKYANDRAVVNMLLHW